MINPSQVHDGAPRSVVDQGSSLENRVVIYGAGGHAHVIIDVLRAQGCVIAAIYDDYPPNRHPAHQGVLPGIRMAGLDQFPKLDDPVVLCIGRNSERAELDRMLAARFAIAQHPTAIVAANVQVGDGTVILHGAVIQTNTRLGRHVLINTAASVDHDNVIGDFAHISPHATLCGHVEIGEGTHVGAGAVVIPKVKVGRWCTVGAGAVVLEDVPDHTTVVGNPARIVPDRIGQSLPDFHELPSL